MTPQPRQSRVRREPTHVLRIEVPIYVDPDGDELDYSPWRDAIRAVLSVTHAAYDGIICDETMVAVEPRTDA